jgi:hypothetical protein
VLGVLGAEEKSMSNPAGKSATYAVIGFVPDEVARSLGNQGYGKPLEIRTERGKDHEVVRIQPDHIVGVLQGASQGGETGVQVILKENTTVETVSRGVSNQLHLRPISDLGTIIHKPPIFVIYIDPHGPRLPDVIRELNAASR